MRAHLCCHVSSIAPNVRVSVSCVFVISKSRVARTTNATVCEPIFSIRFILVFMSFFCYFFNPSLDMIISIPNRREHINNENIFVEGDFALHNYRMFYFRELFKRSAQQIVTAHLVYLFDSLDY